MVQSAEVRRATPATPYAPDLEAVQRLLQEMEVLQQGIRAWPVSFDACS